MLVIKYRKTSNYEGLYMKSFAGPEDWPYVSVFNEGGDWYWQDATPDDDRKNAPNGPFPTSFAAYQDAYKHGGL